MLYPHRSTKCLNHLHDLNSPLRLSDVVQFKEILMTAPATSRLGLPFLQAGQALKNITHNEALQRLDAGLYLSCSDMAATSLPSDPPEGLVILISQTPDTGLLERIGQIAVFSAQRWTWFTPKSGWSLWDMANETLRMFNGTAWVNPIAETGLERLPQLGLNASATPNQRLSVSSETSLFNHDGDNHRMTINRASATDTASLIFQTGFAGQAELGLTGPDGFSLKTSDDGSNFADRFSTPENYAGIQSPAFRSARIRLASNTAEFIETPASGGIVALTIVHGTVFPRASHSGIFAYDVGHSPELITLASTSRVENHGVTILDGSLSAESNIGISVDIGGLYLENGFLNSRDISLTFLC